MRLSAASRKTLSNWKTDYIAANTQWPMPLEGVHFVNIMHHASKGENCSPTNLLVLTRISYRIIQDGDADPKIKNEATDLLKDIAQHYDIRILHKRWLDLEKKNKILH